MSKETRRNQALSYHSSSPSGKVEVVPTKNVASQLDLSLAYSPGVAEPCKEIHAFKDEVYKYTSKGNLVAVISNGTAVLGLGDIGPEASKPVMEGKGVLFKRFAGIDVFDLEVDETDPDKFIAIVKSLEPTFGGINLEDIKAPESFKIEQELQQKMGIPVMHDDQHGTAIISAAGLLNALAIVGKRIEELRLVVSGAGAAAMACIDLYLSLGVRKENVLLLDSKGVLYKGRKDLSALKQKYALETKARTVSEALEGADMFLGLSKGNLLSQDMLRRMRKNPIVFALANPDPEIGYELAMSSRDDIIMATGRSDHPNQVNNVLGFPYIFRGALDVRATCINKEMKVAAVKALSSLTQRPVPDNVLRAYGLKKLTFGREYLIPKPLDPRLITEIAPAVARAAMDSGVSRLDIYDWDDYKATLERRIGVDSRIMTRVVSRRPLSAKKEKKFNVVFSEGENLKVIKAAHMISEEGIGRPILLGNRSTIRDTMREHDVEDSKFELLSPFREEKARKSFARLLFQKRQRKGIIERRAELLMSHPNHFGLMMLETGQADVFVGGVVTDYVDTLLPALQIIGKKEGVRRVASMQVMSGKKGTYFLADTNVNLSPTAEELADLVGLTADTVRQFEFEPKIALLSYTNFSSSRERIPTKVRQALALSRAKYPDLVVEGDIHANVALSRDILKDMFSFSPLAKGSANTLIFPDLTSGNIASKLLAKLADFEVMGPILMGMRKKVCVLQNGASARDIFNMVTLTTTMT